MPSEQTAWNPPPLSTDSRAALARYRLGVAALVAGIAHADGLLAEAVAADPSFLLARVGLAVARVTSGHPYVSPRPVTALQRGERQHLEIVDAALTGARSRADDLRKEHLLEYPGDLLIVWLPRSDLGPADSARLAAPRSSPPVQVRPRCEGRERYPGSAQPLRPGGRRRPAVASLRSRR